MSRKERCPMCKKAVKGLWENNLSRKDRMKAWILRAFYCPHCDKVLLKDQIVYAQIEYIKKEIK